MSEYTNSASTTYVDIHGHKLRWSSHPEVAAKQFIPLNGHRQAFRSEVPAPRDPEHARSIQSDIAPELGEAATLYTLALYERDLELADSVKANLAAYDTDPLCNPYLRAWGDKSLPDWENELLDGSETSEPIPGEMVMRLGVVIGEVADDGTTAYIDHTQAAPKQPRKRKRFDRNGQPIMPPYRDRLQQRPVGGTAKIAEQASYVLEFMDTQSDQEQARDAAHMRELAASIKRSSAEISRLKAQIAELEQRPELLDYKAHYHELSSIKSYLISKQDEARENGEYSSEVNQRIDAELLNLRAQLATLERDMYEPTVKPIDEQIDQLQSQKITAESEKYRAERRLRRLIRRYQHLTGDYEYDSSGNLTRPSAAKEHGSASASHRPSRDTSKSSDARDVRYFADKHVGGAYVVGDDDGAEPFDVLADDTPYPELRPDDAAELGAPEGTVWSSLEPVGRGGTERVYGDWDEVPELDFLLKPNRGTDPIAYVDGYDPQENDIEYEGDDFHVTDRF